MVRKTTLTVTDDTRKRAHRFKDALGCDSVDEAIMEAFDIAAAEGYWDDGGAEPTAVSVERVDELEETIDWMTEAFFDLRSDVQEHHDIGEMQQRGDG